MASVTSAMRWGMALSGDAQHRGMDVDAVRDQLGRGVDRRERGADDARIAMVQRRHGVVEVREVTAPHSSAADGSCRNRPPCGRSRTARGRGSAR